jgi:C-terminal processing protease CtpA/Prc
LLQVHKVLAGSPADRDGRIQKGDRILSINGRSMKGVTHRESLNILKVPRRCTLFHVREETVT